LTGEEDLVSQKLESFVNVTGCLNFSIMKQILKVAGKTVPVVFIKDDVTVITIMSLHASFITDDKDNFLDRL
jgi:hypothetical protein